jgi:hypothetical protein
MRIFRPCAHARLLPHIALIAVLMLLSSVSFAQSAAQAGVAAPTVPFDPVSIVAGKDHACALTSVGRIKCWGRNDFGQLGDGSYLNRTTPVEVTALGGTPIAIYAGGFNTCALLSGGVLRCWGDNSNGQLGANSVVTSSVSPVQVIGLRATPVDVSIGRTHLCAALSTGEADCWGKNNSGQLGSLNSTPARAPVAATGLGNDIVQIAVGGEHTCSSSPVSVPTRSGNWAMAHKARATVACLSSSTPAFHPHNLTSPSFSARVMITHAPSVATAALATRPVRFAGAQAPRGI